MHWSKNYQLQWLWNSLLASSYLTPCLFLICFAEIFKKKPQTPSCLPASPTFHSEWIFKGGKQHCLTGTMSLSHQKNETYGLIPSLQKAILKQIQRQARWHRPIGVFVEPSNSIIQLQFSLIKWYWWIRTERRHKCAGAQDSFDHKVFSCLTSQWRSGLCLLLVTDYDNLQNIDSQVEPYLLA